MIIAVIYATFAVAKRKPKKKLRLVQDSNPWPPPYWCSALGPVARSLVSANRWLRGIKMYRFPWYLMLVSTNHASSNPGLGSRVRILCKPEFSSGFLFTTGKVAYITAMIILHLILHCAVHIYDFHIFKTSVIFLLIHLLKNEHPLNYSIK